MKNEVWNFRIRKKLSNKMNSHNILRITQ